MRLWVFFFFSSRRRHTRFSRDWSSDVCSSDHGIHGREFISTSVDVGEKPAVLRLADDGSAVGTEPEPRLLVLQLPFLFDPPPPGATAVQPILAEAHAS